MRPWGVVLQRREEGSQGQSSVPARERIVTPRTKEWNEWLSPLGDQETDGRWNNCIILGRDGCREEDEEKGEHRQERRPSEGHPPPSPGAPHPRNASEGSEATEHSPSRAENVLSFGGLLAFGFLLSYEHEKRCLSASARVPSKISCTGKVRIWLIFCEHVSIPFAERS